MMSYFVRAMVITPFFLFVCMVITLIHLHCSVLYFTENVGESKVGYNIGPHWYVTQLSFMHSDILFLFSCY